MYAQAPAKAKLIVLNVFKGQIWQREVHVLATRWRLMTEMCYFPILALERMNTVFLNYLKDFLFHL